MAGPSETFKRIAVEFIPAPGVTAARVAQAALLVASVDPTLDAHDIAALARRKYKLAELVPSSTQVLPSGVNMLDTALLSGSCGAVRRHVEALGGTIPHYVRLVCSLIRMYGDSPLVVAAGPFVLGVIHLCDVPLVDDPEHP